MRSVLGVWIVCWRMGKVQVSVRLNESEWLIAGSKRLSSVWVKRV